MQRAEKPTLETGLERIIAKARSEPKLRFDTLIHHVTKERVWANLNNIPKGTDGQTAAMAKETFGDWIEPMLKSMHQKGYKAPPVRRVYIPKPGKQEKRPLGVPCVSDRALQRSVTDVLSAIYEQDFLPCSFGGRPKLGAQRALATLHETISGKKVSWVLEADLKNFFGSLDHQWLVRFVEHRVGDPRVISLMEDDELQPSEVGTPQGGSISVLLSNLYLHYVLDLWFTQVVKARLKGEAYLVRYIDDFVICFQYREDALRVQEVLKKRLAKFGLTLEPTKTKLVEFGKFAQRYASKRGRKRPETIYFLGFTLYCTTNRKGRFKLGMQTEKSRFRRSLTKLSDLMQRMRHLPIQVQVANLNQVLRGHYAYYGIAGNTSALQKVYREVEKYWYKMLNSRNRESSLDWEAFHRIKACHPILRPKLILPYAKFQALAVL